LTLLDPKTERRCGDSFARQQAMTTIGASVLSVAAGEAGHVCAIDPVCFTSKRRPRANGERPLS